MMKMADILNLEIAVVVPHRCLLGEGPVWDAKRKVICWIDILNGEIHEYSPEQNKHRIIQVDQVIGSLVVCKNGDFMAALKEGLGFIDRESGEVSIVASPESYLPDNRFNDGKCDPEGRFWAGTMSHTEEPNAGSVYVLEKDCSLTKKMEHTTISNGMAWSLDSQIFYYIDTPTFEVVAYRYNKTSGDISDKRTVIEISKENGYPDGMTIDTEGMLWIAHWDGWQVTRWNPGTGEKLQCIRLPVSRVTSCTFGGKKLDELYITSAMKGLTEDELKEQPLAGSLFVVRNSGFKGVAAFEFGA